MMSVNTSKNKRYQETEERIYQTFTQLLSAKGYSDITVHDICTGAKISRPTFYAHYEDINDMIIQMEQEKGTQIQKLLIPNGLLSVHSFEQYFYFLKENRGFYLAYLTASSGGNITSRLMDTFLHTQNIPSSDRVRYQMLFFMAGLKSIAHNWLLNDCQVPIRLLAEIAYDQYGALFG